MTNEQVPPDLTVQQKIEVCSILSVGCDRQTAADYIGCTLADLRRAMGADAAFLASVRQAEAGIELVHMRNVQQIATKKPEWRASVWWLESRSPERFARRAGTITPRQLRAFVAVLCDAVQQNVQNADDRARVIARLTTLAESVDQWLRDNNAEAVARPDTDLVELDPED